MRVIASKVRYFFGSYNMCHRYPVSEVNPLKEVSKLLTNRLLIYSTKVIGVVACIARLIRIGSVGIVNFTELELFLDLSIIPLHHSYFCQFFFFFFFLSI